MFKINSIFHKKETKPQTEQDADLQEIVLPKEETPEEVKARRKRRIANVIYDLCILIGVGCLVYGGYSIYETYRDSKEAKDSYGELNQEFVKKPEIYKPDGATEDENRTTEWYEQIWVDLEGMQTQINRDIIGWIHFENEDISYPLLYSEDNATYHRVRYDKKYSRGGSIFLDSTNSWDLSDARNIIYGHNMRDESMFGKLKRYNQVEGYYEDHQYFQILHDGMAYRYQIFSYFMIHETEVEYIDTSYQLGQADYGDFIRDLVEKSMKQTDVEVGAGDPTITLVTCAPDNTYRFLVNAVLVDEHLLPREDGTYPDPDEPDTDDPGSEEPGTDEPGSSEPGTETPGYTGYTFTPVGKTMMVTTLVKLRNMPSTDGVRIAYVQKHTSVYVESICNETGWYRVQIGRKTGYINSNYVVEGDLHQYTSTVSKEPTCTEAGEMKYTCDCGYFYLLPIAPCHKEVMVGTAEVHSKCELCETIVSTTHTYTQEVIREATETETGEMKYTCSCGYSYTEEIPVKEPGGSEPGSSEPGSSEPGSSEPGSSEPGSSEPGGSEPGSSEPGSSEPGGSEPGSSEPGSSEPNGSESGNGEQSGTENGGSQLQEGLGEPTESEMTTA